MGFPTNLRKVLAKIILVLGGCVVLLALLGHILFRSLFGPQVYALDVTSAEGREALDRYFWGERVPCVHYAKGVLIHARDSVASLKCTLDPADASWSRFENCLKEKWSKDPDDVVREEGYADGFTNYLDRVDFVPGTVVAKYNRDLKDHRGNEVYSSFLILREADGRQSLYFWCLDFPHEVLRPLLKTED